MASRALECPNYRARFMSASIVRTSISASSRVCGMASATRDTKLAHCQVSIPRVLLLQHTPQDARVL